MSNKRSVLPTENVARILSPEWIEDGELMHEAFMLNVDETYLSVNRPSVDSYTNDVFDFIYRHPNYKFSEHTYKRAILNVGDIEAIDVSLEGITAKIDVEVEARDCHTKSHAGIFTRFQNSNIKRGQVLNVGTQKEGISTDTILLEVRMNLLAIATVEDRLL